MAEKERLLLPCLRAQMGDWVYYVTLMKFSDISLRVSTVADIHKTTSLKSMIQRELTNRADNIAKYLKTEQRFFNAIIVALYGGKPEWFPIGVEVKESSRLKIDKIPEFVEDSIGLISLNGKEELFALDGQHRVEGIKQAIEKDSKGKLSKDEQTVIFVAHNKDAKGMERSRRLFATLNRYAKKIDQKEIIALDEDDILAILTRDLIDEHSFLSMEGCIYTKKGKQVPRTDSTSFTSIVALYEGLDILLSPPDDYRRIRPEEKIIKEYYDRAERLWDILIAEIPSISSYATNIKAGNDKPAVKYRNSNGGDLFFRPTPLLATLEAVKKAHDIGWSYEKIVKKIAKMPLELSKYPWAGLFWDPIEDKMKGHGSQVRSTAAYLILHMAGIDLSTLKQTKRMTLLELKKHYAGYLNKELSSVKLPDQI